MTGAACQIIAVPEVGGGRICAAAEGLVDIGVVERPFSHWDLAAAHAVIKAAGGEIVDATTKEPISYANPELSLTPCFGASHETLKLLGLSNDSPRVGRTM